jgi:proteasome accessory factor A
MWEEVLAALERDPDELVDRLDWVAKRALMTGFMRRDGLSWDAPRLQLIDLQYADLRPDKGLAARLEQRGSLRRLFTDDEVATAVDRAPEDTRAWFRGECIRRYPDAIAAASWDSVVFDVPGRESLLRVPTLEPVRGTRSHVEALLDSSPDVATLIARLAPDGSR